MRIQNILLASLFIALYGCQPEAPAPKVTAPAAAEPSASPVPAAQTAQPVANEAAASSTVQSAESVPATARPAASGKTATAGKEKAPQPVVAAKPAPAQEIVAAKVEPAPVAAEAKPEAKAEVKSGPAVSEADFMQLAKKNNCFACHSVDKKVVGPSFKDVAAKYRGDAGAEARLADKIAKGGSGVWGAMAMPASPKISETDRRVLAKYVLSLK